MRADAALEVVHEGMHFFVRRGPVELPIRVDDVAVERGDCGVDQVGHDAIFADPEGPCTAL